MPAFSIIKLLPLGTVDDLMHFCTRPSALCNSASGLPRHLGVIVLTMLQTGMKKLYTIIGTEKLFVTEVTEDGQTDRNSNSYITHPAISRCDKKATVNISYPSI